MDNNYIETQQHKTKDLDTSWIREFYFSMGLESLNFIFLSLFAVLLSLINKSVKANKEIILNFIDKKDNKEYITERQINSLKNLLGKLNEYLGSERSLLLLNHNGEVFLGRQSFIKCTAIVEECERGKTFMIKKFVNLPQTFIHRDTSEKIIHILDKEGFINLDLIFSNRELCPYSIFLEEGSYGYCIIKIPNIANIFLFPLGYLLITFEEGQYKEFLKNSHVLNLKKYLVELLSIVGNLKPGSEKKIP